LVVSDMKKALRTGKVLVDWSQNDEHKTTVSIYSLRARERPTVSTPVSWEEVEQLLKKKDPRLAVFEAPQVLERIATSGDLFEPVVKLKQKLPQLDDLLSRGALGDKQRRAIAAQASARAEAMARKTERRGPHPAPSTAGATKKKSVRTSTKAGTRARPRPRKKVR